MIIKADLHTHTDASIDGRQTLPELIAAAKKRGLDAIAVTDHNYFQSLPEVEELLLIPGCEFSTDEGHITGLFLEEAPTVKPMQTAAQAIDEIHRCGGIAVLAHPYQKVFERTVPHGIDAIETANARAPYKYKGANILAYALADEEKLPGIGGSDAHSIHELGNAYTEINVSELNKFEDGTVVDATLLKETGVISKILDGVVVLGRGELTKKITVKAARVTAGAAKKIEAAGGKVEVI